MKTNKKTMMFVGVAVLLCLIVAGIVVLMLNSDERRLNRQLQLGQKYLEEMDYEQAVVAFNEAIKIDPANVDAYFGLADAQFRLGEYEDSLVCVDRLLELDHENTQIKPILTDCLNEYIKILAEEERYEEIKALAEKYGTIADGVDFKSVLAKAPVQVEVLKTDIEADSVFNTEGYGSIQSGSDRWIETDNGWIENDAFLPTQAALIGADGSMLFPYQNTYQRYRVSDGIVSLTGSSAYYSDDYSLEDGIAEENLVQYYHLDGSSAIELECTTNEYEDYELNGTVFSWVEKNCFWRGTPMQDGYALVINQINWSYWGVWAGGNDWEYHSYIIDRSGSIVCTLPEEFNEIIAFDPEGFDTQYSLGWCGEGLFAVFKQDYDENWNYSSEVKGYMDFTGHMALDLSGSGFTNLWPFHGGLAAVLSEDYMTGFIDKSGKLVIPCIYESFSGGFGEDGLCAVQKDGKWGYIDRNNNVVIPFEYDDSYGADAGLASVIKDGKCGLVDYQNRIVADFEYDDISSPDEGVAYAIKDRTLYIITVK